MVGPSTHVASSSGPGPGIGLYRSDGSAAPPGSPSCVRKPHGLDSNQCFHHVETIAAVRIGRETTQYVANISKYYIAFRLIAEQRRDGLNSERR